MSVIAGILGGDGFSPDRGTLERMGERLARFAPHGLSEATLGGATMVRALFRTTPEHLLDRQPIRDPSSSILLVFDGRLDNREALAEQLRLSPPRLARLSDADVVFEAVLQWGDEAPAHLVGDFAMAVWDNKARRLWLARDPLGVRPLFWMRLPAGAGGLVAFASKPGVLFAIPGVERRINHETLARTLALEGPAGDASFYLDVQRVLPGHAVALSVDRTGSLSVRRRFFDVLTPKREIRFARDCDYVDAFREHLDRAVASCLRVRQGARVATHLSSGLDSTTVTALAALHWGQRSGQDPLLAMTVAPPEGFGGAVPRGRHADESVLASLVAARYPHVEHWVYRYGTPAGSGSGAGMRALFPSLDTQMDLMDRPPLNLCNAGWTWQMNEALASAGVSVVLTGWFGNFGVSYEGQERLPALLRQGRWLALIHELRCLGQNFPDLGRTFGLESTLGPYVPHRLWRRWKAWRLGRGARRAGDPAGLLIPARPHADGRRRRLRGLRLMDPGEYALLGDALGVEHRHPLGDARLLRYLLAIPEAQFLSGGVPRWLLLRAMEGVLPPEILRTRTRGLQAPDWYRPFEDEASRDALLQEVERLDAVPGVCELMDLPGLAEGLAHGLAQGLAEGLEPGGSAASLNWAAPDVVAQYRLGLLRGLAVGEFVARHRRSNASGSKDLAQGPNAT